MCDLVGVVVADDAFVLGQAQLAALICGQSKGGQEARSQSVDWGIVIGNCIDTETNVQMLPHVRNDNEIQCSYPKYHCTITIKNN